MKFLHIEIDRRVIYVAVEITEERRYATAHFKTGEQWKFPIGTIARNTVQIYESVPYAFPWSSEELCGKVYEYLLGDER